MNKFYINNEGKIESISIEDLRHQLNRTNGTPMSRGTAPKYEYSERMITEFVVGYNSFGKFHECDKFDTEQEAIEWLNSACDELISSDQERSYYDSEADAQNALDEINNDQ